MQHRLVAADGLPVIVRASLRREHAGQVLLTQAVSAYTKIASRMQGMEADAAPAGDMDGIREQQQMDNCPGVEVRDHGGMPSGDWLCIDPVAVVLT